MISNLPFLRRRIAVALGGQRSVASDLIVCWTLPSGGGTEFGTGGWSGGTETMLSGTTRAFGHETLPKNVERQFAEIAAGDLIIELAPEPLVTLCPGQILSGSQPLAALEGLGLRYVWHGQYYVSKEVGPDLQRAWDAFVGNVTLCRTLLLTRAT